MNPRSMISTATWSDLARETVWTLTTRAHLPVSSTWQMPRYWLGLLTVEWPASYVGKSDGKWLNPLRDGLADWCSVVPTAIPQPYENILIFNVRIGRKSWRVAVDFADRVPLNRHAVTDCAVYFKYQYQRGGYDDPNVVPGGFVPNSQELYRYLPHLRRQCDNGEPAYQVYGRFSLDFAGEIRTHAVNLLNAQTRFPFEGGLKRIRYSRFLREVAQARICIDLPGNGDFCFRLFDYMAVGACIIGPRPGNELHHPLVDREHVVWCKDDLSDLVDLCAYYLEHEEERQRLVVNSRNFFDHYIHRQQLAGWYLHCFHQRFDV